MNPLGPIVVPWAIAREVEENRARQQQGLPWPGLIPETGARIRDVTEPVGTALHQLLLGPMPAPPVESVPQALGDPADLLMYKGKSSAGPGNFSFETSAPKGPINVLELLAQLKGKTAPTEKVPGKPNYDSSDITNSILSGLAGAAGRIGPNSPRGSTLLQLGLGALGGAASGKAEQRQAERQYERSAVEIENQQAQRKFLNELGLSKEQLGGAEAADKIAAAAAPDVKATANAVIVPSQQGDKIRWDVKQLPSPKSEALQYMAVAAMNDIPTLFQSLALSAPAALDAAAKKIGVESQMLRGVGLGEKTVDLATQARIMNYIRQNDPQNYMRLQQMAAQHAITKSLLSAH